MEEEEAAPTHGTLAGFAARKSSYLRISPTLVLQLILYLEPHHVEWMNVGVFERLLVALRERIPRKVEQEDLMYSSRNKQGGKSKDKVDVFRGSDYQMAFFFRKTNDKHVVLLKEKHLHYTTRSVPRRPRSPSNFPTSTDAPPPPPHPHTKPPSHSHASPQPTNDDNEDALGMMGPPTIKRRKKNTLPRGSDDSGLPLTALEETEGQDLAENDSSERRREEQEEGTVQGEVEEEEEEVTIQEVKPEPIDEDPLVLLSEGRPQEGPPRVPLFREESQTPAPGEGMERGQEGQFREGEFDEELDEDVKPDLKVNYQKFEIFNRSLVVIVEPYPPLTPSQTSTLLASTTASNRSTSEIRQLSASVQPQSRTSQQPRNLDGGREKRSESVYSRAGSLSVTPVPTTRRGGERSLFRRSETTPLNDDGTSDRGTPGFATGEGEEEEDQQLRELREMSEIFRTGNGKEEDDEDLPSVDQLLERRKRKIVVDT